MKPKELLEILSVAEKLKCNTRHCYTSSGRRESVAEHSWRLALMALLVADEIVRRFDNHDIHLNFVGPVIGNHSGPGTVALFFVGSKR